MTQQTYERSCELCGSTVVTASEFGWRCLSCTHETDAPETTGPNEGECQ